MKTVYSFPLNMVNTLAVQNKQSATSSCGQDNMDTEDKTEVCTSFHALILCDHLMCYQTHKFVELKVNMTAWSEIMPSYLPPLPWGRMGFKKFPNFQMPHSHDSPWEQHRANPRLSYSYPHTNVNLIPMSNQNGPNLGHLLQLARQNPRLNPHLSPGHIAWEDKGHG